ncbi:HIT domain-containing protein [Pontibacillus yanchengensis]|uniref:HIT domain-containing protein n=3 Tax=Pontibacillus yanchengensis TaxID=462910 RepID=A0ACC7VCB8_9BACI|nr:HIT domain-containing protein [Pontibacillus yanchengensis]MYL35396.1 HIT domain-containing protein [Pontibacillus yanchengensis]MYL52427.1 HIT domain-containing protein [Pontibacillus yanchengensis]
MEHSCVFCALYKDSEQQIVMETEYCYFIQKPSEQEVLEGSGLIIPKQHHETVFDLTEEEWTETRKLLLRAKKYLDEKYQPNGYSVGWNVNQVGGQSIPHAHLHIIPRYEDEPYAGKGIRYWMKQPENKRR